MQTDIILDRRRRQLCSRNNADRLAQQMCEETALPFAVVRTTCRLQPYRVVRAAETTAQDAVELEVVAL
ncbi:hypothetical protein [Novosphingobium sp. AP12]|uniref:hypothetical protein n=1 Tax=Novosphingobium sp. AP12 TaxID=1144305 RepID=UPI0005671C81|nr:hypothetical protein [Novosphingobium sp. AP12]